MKLKTIGGIKMIEKKDLYTLKKVDYMKYGELIEGELCVISYKLDSLGYNHSTPNDLESLHFFNYLGSEFTPSFSDIKKISNTRNVDIETREFLEEYAEFKKKEDTQIMKQFKEYLSIKDKFNKNLEKTKIKDNKKKEVIKKSLLKKMNMIDIDELNKKIRLKAEENILNSHLSLFFYSRNGKFILNLEDDNYIVSHPNSSTNEFIGLEYDNSMFIEEDSLSYRTLLEECDKPNIEGLKMFRNKYDSDNLIIDFNSEINFADDYLCHTSKIEIRFKEFILNKNGEKEVLSVIDNLLKTLKKAKSSYSKHNSVR